MKNLRCFPFCSDTHQDKRFCGRSIVVSTKLNCKIEQGLNSEEVLKAYSYFAKLDDDPLYKVGNLYSLGDVISRERSKANPSFELYKGTLLTTSAFDRFPHILKFEFNQEKAGWNYKWVANVHTHKQTHHLVFVFFMQVSSNPAQLRCLQVYFSPEFQVCSLYSRRKTKSRSEEESNISVENEQDPAFEAASQGKLKKVKIGVKLSDTEELLPSASYPFRSAPVELTLPVSLPPFSLNSGFLHHQQSQPPQNIFNPFQFNMMGLSPHPGALLPNQMHNLHQLSMLNQNITLTPNANFGDSIENGLTSLSNPAPLEPNPEFISEEPEIPEKVKPFFTEILDFHEPSEEEKLEQGLVNRKFWRFCCILTMIESHWNSKETIQNLSSSTSLESFQIPASNQGFDVDPLLLFAEENDSFFMFPEYSIRNPDLNLMKTLVLETSTDEKWKLDLIHRVRTGFMALANYLISEDDFTLRLSKTLRDLNQSGVDKIYKKRLILLRFFLDETKEVLKKFNTSYHDFERVFDKDPPDEIVEIATQRLRIFNELLLKNSATTCSEPSDNNSAKSVPSATTLKIGNFGPNSVDVYEAMQGNSGVLISELLNKTNVRQCDIKMSDDNLQGWWLLSDSVHRAVDFIRESFLNCSWLARRLLRSSERHFNVKRVDVNKIMFIGRKKLLATGTLTLKCDGKKHRMTERTTAFFPISMPSIKYYRALVLQKHVILERYFHPEENSMLQVIYEWKDDELLACYHYFYELDSAVGSWKVLYHSKGWVLRCNQGPKLDKQQLDNNAEESNDYSSY